ncbi:hypothetical protein D1839_18030 [Roseburia sp. 1XD42-34]|nr:hypothetical protein [Roseburia sp. 1XD42-34]RKI74727.1 hypothetical protein D7V87_18110 [Clostridium sp. 1xD42-85]
MFIFPYKLIFNLTLLVICIQVKRKEIFCKEDFVIQRIINCMIMVVKENEARVLDKAVGVSKQTSNEKE